MGTSASPWLEAARQEAEQATARCAELQREVAAAHAAAEQDSPRLQEAEAESAATAAAAADATVGRSRLTPY
jgi:uncharacterized protein involved in exopolysaccharide biosynthesis